MRTWAIVRLNSFSENIQAVRARVGKTRICVSVKADGYGHGALQIAETSLESGAFCLGVAAVAEGAELRNGGIKAQILLFSQPHLQEIPLVIDLSLTPFVSDSWFANALNEEALVKKTRLPVHLKIDTGMGRTGCRPEEAPELAKFIASCAGLELAGTATHFAVSDSVDVQDIAYTKTQISRFNEAVNAIRAAGIDPGIVHAANSGAVILHPDAWLDMVRPGILLYGYKAVEENEVPPGFLQGLLGIDPLRVEPVMEFRSIVASIRTVKKRESVSYGRTWIAGQDTNIAVLSAGYADGLPRLASNKWQVVIGGKVYPLVGRICMDQCCVDLGPQTDVCRWDEAIIFGGPAKDAAALASAIGTIPYEITCNINKRVPRIYKT